jgi:hypothetical protein
MANLLYEFFSRRWMIVTVLIELAMDHKPSHREMASCLISELYQKVISQRDLGKGRKYHFKTTTKVQFLVIYFQRLIIS